MPFATPLRYPGGKGRLAPWLAELLTANDLRDATYVEPYAGGAGAALLLLTGEKVAKIIINDIDPAIYAFWWAVLNDSDRLIARINRATISVRTRERHRKLLMSAECDDLGDVAFAAFVVNRTSRSGILTGGVIGGKDQKGPYKLDARFNRKELTSRIRAIAALKDRIHLCGVDAIKLIDDVATNLPCNSLIYFDPPYYNKGSQLYRNFYNHSDHAMIAKKVRELKTPWLVSYDACDEIRTLYDGVPSADLSLYYSTHLSRATRKEVVFYNNLAIGEKPYMRR